MEVEDDTRNDNDRWTPNIKSTACKRCHARKVKCSGGQPCNACKKAAEECVYPDRHRRIRVNESFLRHLIAENKRLKNQFQRTSQSSCPLETPDGPRSLSTTVSSPLDRQGSSSPDLPDNEQPWFIDITLSHTPTPISEAADTAFATRLRQFLSGPSSLPCTPLPHTDYAGDDTIMSLAEAPHPWPKPSRARLLLNVALMHTSRGYHIVRRSVVFDALERSFDPGWRDTVMTCKLRALFALGELCSSKFVSPGRGFPGLAHFAQATKILNYLGERPTLDFIELRLILSLYSFTLNRVYACYTLAGSALRMAVILGLHLNMPSPQQHNDPAEREHRIRVWWTAYVLDRMFASVLGCPPAIQDEDVKVDLPSTPNVEGRAADDFRFSDYHAAFAKLAGISMRAVRSIYTRHHHASTLFSRVQQRVKELKAWVKELPQCLHLTTAPGPCPAHHSYDLLSLHLTLNQTIILATRPILLYALRLRQGGNHAVAAPAQPLIDTCVRCARHSCRILSDNWINGAFPALYHDLARYLFSALLVLAASSRLGHADAHADRDRFDEAAELLSQLRDGGNFAAREFYRHVELIMAALERAEEEERGLGRRQRIASGVGGADGGNAVAVCGERVGDGASPNGASRSTCTAHARGNYSVRSEAPVASGAEVADTHDNNITPGAATVTGETALAEPSLEELLMRPAIEMQFPDTGFNLFIGEGDGALYWPEFGFQS
ncbi:hypothetical protein VTK26DRAFT_8759 [Humicola hyalothermophila]